jgi:hypothetical protein
MGTHKQGACTQKAMRKNNSLIIEILAHAQKGVLRI